MYSRDDLTVSMFYASSTEESGNRVATLTVLVNDQNAVSVHSSQLLCTTDTAKKVVAYSIGEQLVSNGSDPLLVAIENYWRENTEAVVKKLMTEVIDFVSGNINTVSTWIGSYGMKVFESEPLVSRMPKAVLDADGGVNN